MKSHERIILAGIESIGIATLKELSPHVGMFAVDEYLFYLNLYGMLRSSCTSDLRAHLENIGDVANVVGPKLFFDSNIQGNLYSTEKKIRVVSSFGPKIFSVNKSCPDEVFKNAITNRRNAMVFGTGSPLILKRFLKFIDRLIELGVHGIICSIKQGIFLRSIYSSNDILVACHFLPEEPEIDLFKAIHVGVDYLIIGRQIINPPIEVSGPIEAAQIFAEKIELALNSQKL